MRRPIDLRRILRWLLLACAAAATAAAQAESSYRVLVLYSNSRPLPANLEFSEGLERGLHDLPRWQPEVSNEYLDSPRFGGAAYEAAMTAYLRGKYAQFAPQVIVAAGEMALKFLLGHRRDLFPGVPIVHAAVDRTRLPALGPMPPDVIGVPVDYDFRRTLEQALRWHGRATRLVIVTGTSDWDRSWDRRLREEARELSRPLELVPLSGLATSAVLERVRGLGPETIVFTPGYFRDGGGRVGTPRESVAAIAAASGAPVYGPYSTLVGTGVVGGVMTGYPQIGETAAALVAALLRGEPAAQVVVPAALPMSLVVDWRALQRAGVPAAEVPGDAIVRFRAPSFWEAYGQLVLVGLAVIVLQTGLIAALLVERARRRRTAALLARSEQRMSLAAGAANLTTWSWSPAAAGHEADAAGDAEFGPAFAHVDPADRQLVADAVRGALRDGREFEVEYRLAGPDGEPRWHTARGGLALGKPQQLVGVAFDITPRKLAEAQAAQDRSMLRHMTRVSLLGQMSASIAHQLNQPLASILANAEAARRMLARSPVDVVELRAICDDIVSADHLAAEVIRRLGGLFKRGERASAPLEFDALVRDTLDLLRTELSMRRVTVEAKLASAPAMVDGDRVQLQQLLLNLILNAAEAMAAMPEPRRRIAVQTEQAQGQVRLVVADQGPGIAEADLPRIFEPFWSSKGTGMGLGLPICRSIVLAHQGRIEASNAPQGGAVFCAILPALPS
ncbi:MAG: PAS domain-containing protein [Burkholderiaceae bacterium]|nr:PAS domain-containing protein [Burkholderiaceae bacterium]